MNMIHDPNVLEIENLSSVFEEMQQLVFRAVREKQSVHGVENAIWEQLLLVGHKLLGQFFALSGTGDMGATVTLPTGEECQRLEELHERRYVSIFGEFRLQRVGISRVGISGTFRVLYRRRLINNSECPLFPFSPRSTMRRACSCSLAATSASRASSSAIRASRSRHPWQEGASIRPC